jgi:anthranilate phosphoribosyltransferase
VIELQKMLRAMVEKRRTLTREEARETLRAILAGGEQEAAHGAPPLGSHLGVEIGALLTAMAQRGETAAELTGFAEAMREAAMPLPLTAEERAELVDTCGTGGDGLGTFNISTGAALVAAAAGAKVAKHGNRAVTSRSGSADVLETLGVPVGLGPEDAVRCLHETGFMFLLATVLHPAMRRVAPVRRALGFRTIFNLAGPLTNPAGAETQVMGVWAAEKVSVVAEAMSLLGVRHAFVVHGKVAFGVGEGGEDGEPGLGLDELTVTGASHISEVRRNGGMPAIGRSYVVQPEDVGLARAPVTSLGGGGSAEESAAVLLAIFKGEELGARREVVLFNAAAALVAGGVAANLREGIERAAEGIDSGAAIGLMERLRAFRGGCRCVNGVGREGLEIF